MTDPDVPYAIAWATLRAGRYRCTAQRPNGRECRRPTRNVTRNPDGRLVVVCIRCTPRKAADDR